MKFPIKGSLIIYCMGWGREITEITKGSDRIYVQGRVEIFVRGGENFDVPPPLLEA